MKSLIIVIVLSLIAGLYRTFIKKDKNWHKLSESERYDLERTTKSGVELMEEEKNSKKSIVKMKIGLNKYIGETNKKGEPHGKGTMIGPLDKSGQRIKYEGYFKNGLWHGKGTLDLYKRGKWTKIYAGKWKNDKVAGKGYFKKRDKGMIGKWEKGKLIRKTIFKIQK